MTNDYEANPSYLLAKQAMSEQRKYGEVRVVCPKCKKRPKMWKSEHGERTYVLCECRYVHMEEINF